MLFLVHDLGLACFNGHHDAFGRNFRLRRKRIFRNSVHDRRGLRRILRLLGFPGCGKGSVGFASRKIDLGKYIVAPHDTGSGRTGRSRLGNRCRNLFRKGISRKGLSSGSSGTGAATGAGR